MEDKYIKFENESKITFIEPQETIRGNSSKIIYTPCGYEMTVNCNCESCLRGDCEYIQNTKS